MPRTRSRKSEKSSDEAAMPEMELPGTSSEQDESASAAAPIEAPPDAIAATGGEGAGEGAPTASPPESAQQAFGATTWHSDKRIAALWSINQHRNSWVYISGIGWKRLAVNSDSAIVALSMLGAHAKQTQCRVDLREESDGLIHEIYAW